ncbi:MAG: methyltransferase domain-containing protein [Proteobacteria bacterium]|nr:methyltransferase domain-containing protein [Pseudomonadota bacterium]
MPHDDSTSFYQHHAARLLQHELKHKERGEIAPFLELLRPGDRVLDLGCGSGLDLQTLRKAGFEGVGMEGAAARVEIARGVNPGAEILEKNFLFYTPKEAEWGGVWANRSLHHDAPEAVQRVVAALFRGLRIGGVFGLVMYEGTGAFEDREGDLQGPSRLIRPWSEKALCSMLEQSGFKILKVGRKPADPARGLLMPSLFVLAERKG